MLKKLNKKKFNTENSEVKCYTPEIKNPFAAHSFHSKSLFLETKNKEFFGYIGSSNFAQRSYFRDNEMNFYVYSRNPKLKEIFEREREYVLEGCKDIEEVKVKRGGVRKVLDGLFWILARWTKIC